MRQEICSVAVAGVIGCLFAGANPTRPAAAETEAPACVVPKDLVRLELPLKRTARHLASRKLTLIVVLGSSSTAGASSAESAYPSRLMVGLAQRFPTQPLMVLDRGIAGERAVDVLAGFDDTVASDHPDLVLWEVGTNAVLRGFEHAKADSVIREGIRRMKAIGADVVLIDLPFAPQVLTKPEAGDMVDLIANAAVQEKVDVFHRFALMRYWHDVEKIPFRDFPIVGQAANERLGP